MKQLKFRDDGNILEIVERVTKLLGLPNHSATMRVLIRSGAKAIDKLFKHAYDVTRPLKITEIDYFTTSMNITLKARKKEQLEQK